MSKKMMHLILPMAAVVCFGMAAQAAVTDGTYTASADGKDGPVVVETTFEGGVITSVVVTEQNETPEIASLPL